MTRTITRDELRRASELGYTDVREHTEGKHDWLEAGLPLVSGAEVGA